MWGSRRRKYSLFPLFTVVFSSSRICFFLWWGFLSDSVFPCGCGIHAVLYLVGFGQNKYVCPFFSGRRHLWWYCYSIMGSRLFYALSCKGRGFFLYPTATAVCPGVAWFAPLPTQVMAFVQEVQSVIFVPILQLWLLLTSRTVPPRRFSLVSYPTTWSLSWVFSGGLWIRACRWLWTPLVSMFPRGFICPYRPTLSLLSIC